MLDPVTSLGLASNILQLVDFGAKCVKNAREIAEYGCTDEQRRLKLITSDLIFISDQLAGQESSGPLNSLAVETRSVAEELSQLLEKVHINDQGQNEPGLRTRKRSIAKTVVHNVWKKSDINKLEQDLSHLRQQMILRLGAMQSQSMSDVSSHFGVLGHALLDRRNSLLGRCEKHIEDMKAQNNGPSACGAEPGVHFRVLSCLEELADQGRTITKCQHILKSLKFEGLHSREEMITQAHQSTFTWIFQQKRLGFVEWAAQENGIFWITGKPGSGKSTLMKFLVSQPETKALLRQWAGTHRLGVASHYFWNPGTAMQKSEGGLLRKLLHDVIRQFPNEALKAMPPKFVDPGVVGDEPWTVADLRTALETFGTNKDLGTKLCFFIDGLDEYHSDHEDLVECLSSLARCPSIKLCVSSRPWNVFTRAYNNRVQGQLAVQELTRSDIKRVIDDRMNASESFRALQITNPRECTEILDEICEKAQGIFLWVHLVTRSLLRGMHNNDDSIDILRQRVQEYPDTLDGYFDRMLQRIEKVYKTQSARILLVALASEGALPHRTPAYIEQEMKNQNYAQDRPILDANVCGQVPEKSEREISLEQKESTAQRRAIPLSDNMEPPIQDVSENGRREIEKTRRCIDARCGDLLEVSMYGIMFLHRTARDFLEQDDMLQKVQKLATADFDAHLSLTRVWVAHTKSLSPTQEVREADLFLLRNKVLGKKTKIFEANKSFYLDILMHIDEHWDQLFKIQSHFSIDAFFVYFLWLFFFLPLFTLF